MTEVENFVARLEHHGVSFWVEHGRLKWHSVFAVTLEQLLAIKKHEAEIIEILTRRAA